MDLLFSNDETIVDEVWYRSPLGKSDHSCIHFRCDLCELEEDCARHVLMYEKGDYQKMRNVLARVELILKCGCGVSL